MPAFSYLQSVSVIDNNEIEIRYLPDNAANVNGFELYRSEDSGITFDGIELINSTNIPVIFTDNDVETDEQSYQYIVKVLDSCNRSVSTSNVGETILLGSFAQSNILTNLIDWTNYQLWDGDIDRFELYRKVNGYYELNPIAVIPADQFQFVDDISGFIGTDANGKFCYKVIAYEQMNSYGIAETSHSNEFCVDQDPIIYVPNAIYIGGNNNTWKPVVNLMDFTNYTVYIYNRINHLVFESSDKNEVWDGTYLNSNKVVPLGVYIYFIEFKNSRGDYFRDQGHITVIR